MILLSISSINIKAEEFINGEQFGDRVDSGHLESHYRMHEN
jgi:hypothetical protein